MTQTGHRAVFLDRDGTIIVDKHYPNDPADVVLMHGAANAIRRMNAAGWKVVVVTNQSGIGRGLITAQQYNAVHHRMIELLTLEGARIEGAFHCPHWPERDGPCDCRKPGLGLYRQAARELNIDLPRSAYIGDRWRDIEPGIVLGGTPVLVVGDATTEEDVERATVVARVASTLDEAVQIVLGVQTP